MTPLLSILIPSVPSRIESHLTPLYRKLLAQAEGLPVEVLVFLDNKQRSVGLKRQALNDVARGAFQSYVDDDDDVTDDFTAEIVRAIRLNPTADCIVFDQLATVDDVQDPVLVRFGVEYENTQLQIPGGATRKPWTCCAYAAHIAKACRFPDASYAEDAFWVDQAWPMVKHQHRIDRVLHIYRYRPAVTEAAIVYHNDHPPERDDSPEYRRQIAAAASQICYTFPVGPPKTVLDVGCNIGQWSRAFAEWCCKVTAIDSPHMEPHLLEPRPEFIAIDLQHPFTLCEGPIGDKRDRRFDLIVCLEVAEHLPETSADGLIDSLARHGDVVVFSAAAPGQGGWKHLNEREPEYWEAKFAARGFTADVSIRERLPADLPVYYKNMAMFRRV